MKRFILIALSIVQLAACRQATQKTNIESIPVNVPAFSSDSAYHYIKTQVDFGARVPNSIEHTQCAEYLASSLKRFGADVIEQKADLTAFDGKILHATNIIGVFNPAATTRILLCSHWDSRPWSDHDSDPANFNKPVMGANDGASGVGVLMEIARQMGMSQPTVGVDIVFFDAEDYGPPQNFQGESEDSWCLGSQYWSGNPHKEKYNARFGILLDMVGAPNATFYKEEISTYYAAPIVNLVWDKAQKLGFNQYFIAEKCGGITDDHLYVNKITGIPCIDIIHYNPNSDKGFGEYWHTINDTMENIDKNTLHAVGTTVMHLVYSEK